MQNDELKNGATNVPMTLNPVLVTKEENPLVLVVKESGLEATQAQTILESFQDFFKQASDYEKRAKEIVVTEISQVADMTEARKIRLELKNIRVNAEKVKTNLKADILLKGKAIDGIYNVIKALTEPLEKHLEKQEKFAELWAEAQAEKKVNDRIVKLSQFVEDISLYNLKDMSDEAFTKLLENSEKAFNDKKEAERLAEEARLKKIEEDRIENERIRIENEKLKQEAEAREAKEKEEREAREKAEAKAKAEAEAKEKAHQEELRIEREKREELEREAREKKEAEEKAERERLAQEAKAKAEKEEADRQARLAPEKDKLFDYAESIRTLESPEDLSQAGLQIVRITEEKLLKISQEIKEALKNL